MTISIALLILCYNVALAGGNYTFVRIESLAEQDVAENILTHVYKKTGMDINIIAFPGKRANLEVTTGRADGETSRIYNYGEINTNLIRVPTPYGTLETSAFALKEKKLVIKSIEDLKNFRIAIVRGVQHTEDITKGMQNIAVMNDICAMMMFVKLGRADIALTNTLAGIGALKKLKMDDIVAVGTLEKLDLYHYLIPRHRNMVPIVDAAIREMIATGELQELKDRYERQYLENIR
ncbi:transporter substrate-binding domain-containing protein [Desulfomicrobium sp. ZS1]|nr:transporter substrate-binding domain-containing protein [Desulfomicrobium sp. ZS1]UTF51907.1 transporter substrate-binding domain-containing protein [Desulfomicrobium sp. ZS1]